MASHFILCACVLAHTEIDTTTVGSLKQAKMPGLLSAPSSHGLKAQLKTQTVNASLSSRRLQVAVPKYAPKAAVRSNRFQSDLFASKPVNSFASSLVGKWCATQRRKRRRRGGGGGGESFIQARLHCISIYPWCVCVCTHFLFLRPHRYPRRVCDSSRPKAEHRVWD